MNDRQLRYAHAVWHERSFSRAAVKMGVSQPSLSEQIRLLEEELGFSLFYRNSRGVEASANGQAFLESVTTVVDGFSALKDLARELRGKPGATIRIGVNSGLAQTMMPRITRVLGKSTVKISAEIITATTRRILRLVHQQRLDLGLIFEADVKTAADKTSRIEIAQSEIVLLTAPSHPFAKRRKPVDLAELCRHPLIVNEPRLGYGRTVLALFADRDLVPEIAADCDDLESLKYMVRAGTGLALAPRVIAEYELAHGLLSAVKLAGAPRIPLQMIRRSETLAPRLERVLGQLTKEIGELRPAAPATP